jgi:glycosyltransferase involved in cell wall biosynthesis
VISLLLSQRILAISNGMKAEMIELLGLLKQPKMFEQVIEKVASLNVGGMDSHEKILENFEAKVRVLPLAISNEFYSNPACAGRSKCVGSWGRISPEKGFEFLLHAARRLPDCHFSLWGKRPQSGSKQLAYGAYLEQLALSVYSVALDFRDWVPSQEVISKLDEVEVVVIPSIHEPFGLVIVEAMARGKPVIASDTAGSRDIFGAARLGRYSFGYLISNERDRLADGIYECLSDYFSLPTQLKHEMGRAARARAEGFRGQEVMSEISRWLNTNRETRE